MDRQRRHHLRSLVTATLDIDTGSPVPYGLLTRNSGPNFWDWSYASAVVESDLRPRRLTSKELGHMITCRMTCAPVGIFNGRVLRDTPSHGQCLTCCVPADRSSIERLPRPRHLMRGLRDRIFIRCPCRFTTANNVDNTTSRSVSCNMRATSSEVRPALHHSPARAAMPTARRVRRHLGAARPGGRGHSVPRVAAGQSLAFHRTGRMMQS